MLYDILQRNVKKESLFSRNVDHKFLVLQCAHSVHCNFLLSCQQYLLDKLTQVHGPVGEDVVVKAVLLSHCGADQRSAQSLYREDEEGIKQKLFGLYTLKFSTLLHNDPEGHQNQCVRCWIRTPEV